MNSDTPTPNFTPETQRERWIKYGANVALASIVVVILAGMVIYLAQRFDRRIDTTAAGLYSLKPQTVNLIKENKQKIKLVSLYAAKDEKQVDSRFAGPVRDLLEEYSRKGSNIEYQAFDPVTQPTDALLKEAIDKYGGAVGAYKTFVTDYAKTHEKLKEMTQAEVAALANVQDEGLGDDEKAQTIAAVVNTVRETVPQHLSRLKDRVDRAAKAKFPDYKGIVDTIKTTLDNVSRTEAAIIRFAGQLKDDEKVPSPIRAYLSQSPARHEEIQKLADETAKKVDALGELKVGDLQDAIKGQDLILVLGDTDWRVINFEQVWKSDNSEVRAFLQGGEEPKPRFAGEQAVTTAILSLTSSTKPKVVFLRPGGGPLTNPGFPPFQRGGPFSGVAQKLREYNFDVLEKDLSGMHAMQAQMSGQPAAPEPSDEAIKDAVWVVLSLPSQGAPTPATGAKIAQHLKDGGSAMILALPQSDNLSSTLQDYGVEILADTTIVHEPVRSDRGRSGDISDDIQRDPMIIATNKYGDHLLAGPVKSLDSLLARAVPIRTTPTPGVKVTPLLPVPQEIKTWGERDMSSLENDSLKFDESGPNADLAGPMFAGAIAEKDKTRLVVLGNLVGFTNQVLNWPDQEMLRRGLLVSRFPGNGELFANSIFWLSRMEPMIAISPSAMEVSRIRDMDSWQLAFWKVGVVLILLPGLVLAAGIYMYFARRD